MKKLIVALSLSIFAGAAFAGGAPVSERTKVSIEILKAGTVDQTYELHLAEGSQAPLVSQTEHAIVTECSVGPSGVPELTPGTVRTGLSATVRMGPSTSAGGKLVTIDMTIVDLTGRSKFADGNGCVIDLLDTQMRGMRSEIALTPGEKFELAGFASGTRQVFVLVD